MLVYSFYCFCFLCLVDVIFFFFTVRVSFIFYGYGWREWLDILWCSVCLSLSFVTFFVKKYFFSAYQLYWGLLWVYFSFLVLQRCAFASRIGVRLLNPGERGPASTGDLPVAAFIDDSRDQI